MTPLRTIARCAPFLAGVLIAASAGAAQLAVSTTPQYERLSFGFGAPAHLSVASAGNTITLTFDKPVGLSGDAIRAKLGPHVTGASVGDGGKRVTLTLDAGYRTRQFIGGTGVGIDILTAHPQKVAPQAAQPAPKPAVAKPAVVKPTAKPVAKPVVAKTKPAPMLAKPTPPPTPEPKPKLLKPAPPPAPTQTVPPVPATKPVAAPPPPAPDAKVIQIPSLKEPAAAPPDTDVPHAITTAPPQIMTTKQPTPAVVPSEGDEEAPPPAPAKPEAKAPPAKSPSAPKTEAVKPAAPEAKSAPKSEAALPTPPEPPKEAAGEHFLVTAQSDPSGTWINFPWKERVAAAAFERGGDIWLVFSKPQHIDTALLKSVLPESVSAVEQFRAEGGDTVLRLTTDGSLHVTARQPKGSYRWQMLLSPHGNTAALDTPVTAQSDDDKNSYLLISLFDMAEPLRFYDPRVGDLVLVLPAFEEGRGEVDERRFPAITLLSTQQGMALTALRDDLKAEKTRVGLKVLGLTSLSASLNLPTITAAAKPVTGAADLSGVMIPYEQWYVPPDKFVEEREKRLAAIATAAPATKPDAILAMAQLMLGEGFLAEAKGNLDLLAAQYPDYFREHKLALLEAACKLLLDRPQDAVADINAPELTNLAEAQLWKEAIGLFTQPATSVATANVTSGPAPQPGAPAVQPQIAQQAEQKGAASNAGVNVENPKPLLPTVQATAPEFDYLGYDKPIIRFYPPTVRRKLAQLAAQYYLLNDQPEKALNVYDTLNRDGILKSIEPYAEYTLAMAAAKKGDTKQAEDLFDQLSKQQDDFYIQTRARYENVLLHYAKGDLAPETAEAQLEEIHTSWHGGPFERELLGKLANIYRDNKDFAGTLRTWKYMLAAFPGDPETLTVAGNMSQLFTDLFLNGGSDQMPPLKSLALFYEFRELTPIGPNGDAIIQKLADRLASVDLLDRAAQLLDNQLKFRLTGVDRARVGARLALIYLLNQQPDKALDTLQTTNFGGAPAALVIERQQLTAQALSKLGKNEEALSMLYSDTTQEGALLRLDILWAMADWPNIINTAENILSTRPNLTEPLNARETNVLIKLALAYSFEGDMTQLGYLRDYYIGLVPDGSYKEIFSFITSDTARLSPDDFDVVAKQISHTQAFLDLFKSKIQAGKLSDAVK